MEIIILVAILTGSIVLALNRINDKLKRFPGPFLAKYTSLWQLYDQYRHIHDEPNVHNTRQYGSIVRVAPNKLYLGDAAATKELLATANNLNKSEFYGSAAPAVNGKPTGNLFHSLDMKYHDDMRKAFYKSFNNIQQYEAAVDQTVSIFLDQLRTRFADLPGPDGVVDMTKWCHYFTLDAISLISFSKCYGFLESDTDVGGMIHLIESILTYHSYVGLAPWLDGLLIKNPLLLTLQSHNIANTLPAPVAFAIDCQQTRQASLNGEDISTDPNNDLLGGLNRAKASRPDIVNEAEIMKMCTAIVFAGGDSTARTIAALFYHLMANPGVYAKLEGEVDAAPPSMTYAEAQQLPYLKATVKEAMRLFPAARFNFERVTPPSGITIAGHDIPGNTVVGASAWTAHRDKAVWGDDVDVFRPERWLGVDDKRYKFMEGNLALFGQGKYQCLGMGIANMEIFKIVPAILRSFKVELVDGNAKLGLRNGGHFVGLESIEARLTSKEMLNSSAE